MSKKEHRFHSQFQRVTVVSNGVPLSLNAEVEVVIKRPAKLDLASRRAWDQIATDTYATVELIPAEVNPEA